MYIACATPLGQLGETSRGVVSGAAPLHRVGMKRKRLAVFGEAPQ